MSFLSASFAAAGSLATGFSHYFAELFSAPAAGAAGQLVFLVLLTIVNYIGITESVVINMVMAFVEVAGLIIVMLIGVWYVAEGKADFGDAHRVHRSRAARSWRSSPASRSPSSP